MVISTSKRIKTGHKNIFPSTVLHHVLLITFSRMQPSAQTKPNKIDERMQNLNEDEQRKVITINALLFFGVFEYIIASGFSHTTGE